MLKQRKILVTGANGRVGQSLIRYLSHQPVRIFAGVRRPEQYTGATAGVEPVAFDLTRPESYASYLGQMDALFLMRPPQLTQMVHFRRCIDRAVSYHLKFVLFLSVQGANRSRVIPHAKIEKLIRESGLPHCFIRPSWFMQNLEGPLWKDLTERKEIFLPAGKARFLPIHVEDIGSTASQILLQTTSFNGQALDLTGSEKLSFPEMAAVLSEELDRTIRYRSAGPCAFFMRKRKEGLPWDFALVQYMLHFLPRISAEPGLSGKVEEITGRPPRTFRTYARELSLRWPATD